MRAIATRWIYNVKSSLLFKSRLVARGDQRPNSIFEPASDSPTVARSSLNVLLAVAHALGWVTRALDVDCAYLYGDIPDQVQGQVWIKPPLGMQVSLPSIFARRNIGCVSPDASGSSIYTLSYYILGFARAPRIHASTFATLKVN